MTGKIKLLTLTGIAAALVAAPSSADLQREAQKSLRQAADYIVTNTLKSGSVSTYRRGRVLLHAYRVTNDEFYLDGALKAARLLVWMQRDNGGWSEEASINGFNPDAVSSHRPSHGINDGKRSKASTLDGPRTQGALSFLMELDQDVNEDWLSLAIERGLDFMLEAQFDNGAWPQQYPLTGGISDLYTFNDLTIPYCITVLLKAHRQYGKQEYREALERAFEFLKKSQGDPPGWAQQYSHDMKPAWARGMEPPGICSAVTGNVIRTLVDIYIYTGDDNYLSPVPPAIDWLERSRLDNGKWARLYEVGTNRPVYGDRKDPNKKHYDYDGLSKDERSSYSWQSEYGINEVISYYKKVKSAGLETSREMVQKDDFWLEVPPSDKSLRRGLDLPVQEDKVQTIIRTQKENGSWGDKKGWGGMKTRGRNMYALCDYLKRTRNAE